MGLVDVRHIAVYRTLLDDSSHESFLSPFVNIVAMCIYEDHLSSYSIDGLCEKVKSYSGIEITIFPMKKIIGKLINMGILSQEKFSMYSIKDKSVFSDNFNKMSSIRANIENDYDQLIDDFYFYIKEKFSYNDNRESANILLDTFINEQVGKISAKNKNGILLLDEKDDQKKHYYAALFIKEKCIGHDKENIIKKMLVGGVLAESIAVTQTYKVPSINKVRIFFDTPLIFQILGISSFNISEVYQDMIDKVNKLGGVACVFEHSVNEVRKILMNAEYWISRTDYNYAKASVALDYYKRNGKSAGDIKYDIAILEHMIQTKGVQIVSYDYEKNSYKDSESEAEIYRQIVLTYKENNPSFNEERSQETLEIDAKSLNEIFLFRRGLSPVDFFYCKAVLVTSNSSLSYASRVYTQNKIDGYVFPVCITDIFLGTILWLNDTIRLGDLSLKYLTAQIHAAFQPKISFWNCFLEKIEELEQRGGITEGQAHILRTFSITGERLVHHVEADIQNITNETPLDIYKQLLQEGRIEGEKESKEKYEREIQKINQQHQEEVNALLSDEKRKRKEAFQRGQKSWARKAMLKKQKSRCRRFIKMFNVILLILVCIVAFLMYDSFSVFITLPIYIGLCLKTKIHQRCIFHHKIIKAFKIDAIYSLYVYIIKRIIHHYYKKNDDNSNFAGGL